MGAIRAMDEVSFTELLQKPRETAKRLSGSQVLRLRRRGEEDLLLMSLARAERDGQVVETATRLFVSLMRTDEGARGLVQALPEVFPWVRFLPSEDVKEFLVELVQTVHAASEIDNLGPVAQVIAEWKHTAEVYADPELYEILTRHETEHDDYGPVPVPDC